MSKDWREELIDKMVAALINARLMGFDYECCARAALAAAEPVIREQCARIVEKGNYETRWTESERAIAAAIREGGEDRYARG